MMGQRKSKELQVVATVDRARALGDDAGCLEFLENHTCQVASVPCIHPRSSLPRPQKRVVGSAGW